MFLNPKVSSILLFLICFPCNICFDVATGSNTSVIIGCIVIMVVVFGVNKQVVLCGRLLCCAKQSLHKVQNNMPVAVTA